MDGEGSLLLSRHFSPKAKNKFILQPAVAVVNTNLALIMALVAWFGGTYEVRKPKENHKQSYVWHITGYKRIRVFLAKIRPYLLIKRKQADLLLSLIDNLPLHNPGRQGFSAAEWRRREAIYAQVKKLNLRGRATEAKPILEERRVK